jgi:hypothetical protein
MANRLASRIALSRDRGQWSSNLAPAIRLANPAAARDLQQSAKIAAVWALSRLSLPLCTEKGTY